MIENALIDSVAFSNLNTNNKKINLNSKNQMLSSQDFERGIYSKEGVVALEKTSSKNGNEISSLTSVEHQIQRLNPSAIKKNFLA